jgi:hypothetical protein
MRWAEASLVVSGDDIDTVSQGHQVIVFAGPEASNQIYYESYACFHWLHPFAWHIGSFGFEPV